MLFRLRTEKRLKSLMRTLACAVELVASLWFRLLRVCFAICCSLSFVLIHFLGSVQSSLLLHSGTERSPTTKTSAAIGDGVEAIAQNTEQPARYRFCCGEAVEDQPPLGSVVYG